MNVELLNVSPRMPQTKAKILRREGYVPGVIYNDGNTIPVIFDKKNVENIVRHIGENAILEISIDGTNQPVKILQVQRDPITREIIHMDLLQIAMDQKIKAYIPLVFEGKRAVEKNGYILQHQKNTVEVEGYAKAIPTHITVNVANLEGNQNIKVHDLEIAEELSIVDGENEVLASIVRPTREPEEIKESSVPKESNSIEDNTEDASKKNKEESDVN